MVNISVKTWRKNGVEVIVVNGKKWLNEKHVEEQLEHSNLRKVTSKYSLDLRKQRQELQKCDKQPCRRFLIEDFEIHCITTPAVDFKARLGFNQHDPIMTQEQSVLSTITTLFSAEKILLQHHVLGYYIYAYFLEYKLAVKIDQLGHEDRH